VRQQPAQPPPPAHAAAVPDRSAPPRQCEPRVRLAVTKLRRARAGGCLNDALCPPFTSHGASLMSSYVTNPARRSGGSRRSRPRRRSWRRESGRSARRGPRGRGRRSSRRRSARSTASSWPPSSTRGTRPGRSRSSCRGRWRRSEPRRSACSGASVRVPARRRFHRVHAAGVTGASLCMRRHNVRSCCRGGKTQRQLVQVRSRLGSALARRRPRGWRRRWPRRSRRS
jgi:hypothetical protein